MSAVTLHWKDPVAKKGFDVTIKLKKIDGFIRLAGISIDPVGDFDLTVEMYRRVPIIELWKQAVKQSMPKPEFNATLTGAQRGSTLPDDLLEEVATIYKDALNYKLSPIEAVAKSFSISKSTAAKRVMLARKHGYLGKATRGKAG